MDVTVVLDGDGHGRALIAHIDFILARSQRFSQAEWPIKNWRAFSYMCFLLYDIMCMHTYVYVYVMMHIRIIFMHIYHVHNSFSFHSLTSSACHSLLRVARGSNIFFQIMVTFLSYISNACHSLSGVAERLQHTYNIRNNWNTPRHWNAGVCTRVTAQILLCTATNLPSTCINCLKVCISPRYTLTHPFCMLQACKIASGILL